MPKILEKNLVLNGWGDLHGPAIKVANTRAAAPWLRDLCRDHCGGDHFCFFKLFFIDSFLKIYCGGASLEDRTVCQLTQDLVEFYHLLYS